MKLDVQFKDLEMLVSNMGATVDIWTPPDISISEKKPDWGGIEEALKTTGVPINIDDIEIEEDGLLQYQNKQVLLHIKDVSSYSQYGLPKFHFYGCETLHDMKSKGRFKRYIATQRKDGYFIVDIKKNNQSVYERDREENLLPCGNCLKWYNANYKPTYRVDNFDITEFFKQFKSTPIIGIIKPDESYNPDSGYVENWKEISYNLRNKYNWTCQQCGINLTNHKYLLHAHHLGGTKSDNNERNLKVLCVKCHSEQPNHEHMKTDCFAGIREIENIYSSYDVPF